MSVAEKKNNAWFIHLVIMLLLMFGFGYLPAPGSITPYGMRVLGIFLGMIYGWCVPTPTNIYPSLLGLFALSTTAQWDASNVLVSTFGNSTIGLMIISMFFMPAINDCGLGEYLFAKILGSKFCVGKPWRVVIAIQIGMMALCFLVNPFLVLLLSFSVFNNLYELAGYNRKDLFPAFMHMGMMLNCSIVTMKFPWSGMALIPMGSIQRATGLIWPFPPYLMSVIPFIIVCCVGWALLMRVFPGVDASKLSDIDVSTLIPAGGKMGKRQKGALVATLIFIGSCILVAFLGKAQGNVAQQMLFKINVYGVNLLVVALLAVIPVDGSPLLNISSAAKQFPWDLLILFASAVCVGSALVSAEGGIADFLSTMISPFLMKFGGVGFLVVVAIVMMILTNLLNNAAVMVTLSSMIASMFVNGLIDETTMYISCMLVAVVGDIGVLHPGSSATSAMYFGQPMISAKSGYTASITAVIYCLILSIVVMVPLGSIFYNM